MAEKCSAICLFNGIEMLASFGKINAGYVQGPCIPLLNLLWATQTRQVPLQNSDLQYTGRVGVLY